MGWLDKLLGRTWRTYFNKAERYRAESEPGLAVHEYREALKIFDGTDQERAEINTGLTAVRDVLHLQQMERAEVFRKAGQFDRAKDACESALHHATGPEQEANIQRFLASLNLDVSEQARVLAEEHQRLSHADADVAMSSEDERFYILIAGLGEEMAAHYEHLDANFRQGFVALYDQEFKTAHRLLTAARARSEDPFIQTELARAELGLNKPKEAADLLRAAVAANPKSVYIKLRLIEALWTLNDLAAAEAILQEAHDLEPDNSRIHVMIAEHSMRTRDYQAGIEAVNLLISRHPEDWSLLRLRGQLYQAAGQLNAALSDFEAVLKVRMRKNPDTGDLEIDAVAAAGAASIYITGKQRLDRAIDLLHGLLSTTQTNQDTTHIYLNIARAYELKKQPHLARETLQKALDHLPESERKLRTEVRNRLQAIVG